MSHKVLPQPPVQAATTQPSFVRRHWQKIIALLFWLTLLGSYQLYAWRNDISALEALTQILDTLRSNAVGPLLFIVVYTLRPLVLFPATLLTLGAGLVYGPVLGIGLTLIGSNLSAMVAFFIGRFLGDGLLNDEHSSKLIQRYAQRLRSNSFETVLIMRSVLLPYDVVNYLCGVLQINWRAYLLATIIGSLPGTVAFVLAGASIKSDLAQGLPSIDPRVFAVSVVMLVISLVVSRYVKSKEQRNNAK